MTTIAGVTDKEKVLMGCDSSYTQGYQQHTGPSKVFAPAPGWLVGVTGSYKIKQLLQFGAPRKFYDRQSQAIEELMMKWFPIRLLKLLEENKLTFTEEGAVEYNGAIMVAVENKLFVVGSDFSVLPVEDFAAIGNGAQYAYGVAYVWKHVFPKEKRLRMTLEAACHYDIYTTEPIEIRSTI